MQRIIKENRPFTRYDMTREEGLCKLHDEGSRYKIDNAERADGDALSFYVTGSERGRDFEDLCRGPHVPATGIVKAFKIRQVSRSHYRGDVNDTPLQRVYGTAFFKKSSLKTYLEQLEEAKKRDHRVIGKQLALFTSAAKSGSGLVLWLPHGTTRRTQRARRTRAGSRRGRGGGPLHQRSSQTRSDARALGAVFGGYATLPIQSPMTVRAAW